VIQGEECWFDETGHIEDMTADSAKKYLENIQDTEGSSEY
jgi:hypothetical protein